MNSAVVAIIALAALFLGYKFYSKVIEEKLVKPDNAKLTPAHELEDKMDYSPTRSSALFGHHFSSIAGAGPILGPLSAAPQWGWAFWFLWIVLGSVLMGAVHDFTTLVLSIRHKGISVPDAAGEIINPRVKYVFLVVVWITLVLVIAVFGTVSAKTLTVEPRIVIPILMLCPIAVGFGVSVDRMKLNFWLATILALLLLAIFLAIGYYHPVSLPFSSLTSERTWFALLTVYCFIASLVPVWLLLRPRDYLSIYVLFAGLLLGYIGLFTKHAPISTPALVQFSADFNPAQGSGGPLLPMLCITIACGAISGFHCLVSGGTSSKQLDKESDARVVGYGSMIAEAALAVLALLAVTAGLYWKAPIGEEGLQFGSLMAEEGWILTFSTGLGNFLTSIGIPLSIGILMGTLMLGQFVITSLDTCTRLTRFTWTEMIGERIPRLGNRSIATTVPLAIAFYLGWTGNYTIVWPVFATANQIVAALALLTVSAWLLGTKKPTKYTLIPCIIMLCLTTGALLYEIPAFFGGG